MTKLSDIIASFVTGRAKVEEKLTGVLPTQSEEVKPCPNLCYQLAESAPQEIGKEEGIRPEAETPLDENKIVVTQEFEEAFDIIEGRMPFVFVTGKAGTGKSTFISLLKERLKSYAVVAPTGVAALNVGGQTIHSFFRLPPGPINLDAIKPLKNRIAYKALKTLIIDEISMVRADLLDAIDRFLRVNGLYSERPFGGVQVIAVGDLFQLPPVVATDEEQAFLLEKFKSPFFFGARSLKGNEFKVIEFSKVFRQTEETYIELLNSIREGKGLGETLLSLNARVSSAEDGFAGIVLTGTNAAASRINAVKLAAIGAPSWTYRGEIVGDLKIDQNKLPAPMELELKAGARVMCVKNDRLKRFVNGTLGTVLKCEEGRVLVLMESPYGMREIWVEPELWENLKYEYDADKHEVVATKIGGYKQIPLVPAWAVTIHKSQGKTFDRVHVDLERGAFAEGQVYVALSRCRTLAGVTLEKPLRKEDICLNFDVIEFMRGVALGACERRE